MITHLQLLQAAARITRNESFACQLSRGIWCSYKYFLVLALCLLLTGEAFFQQNVEPHHEQSQKVFFRLLLRYTSQIL